MLYVCALLPLVYKSGLLFYMKPSPTLRGLNFNARIDAIILFKTFFCPASERVTFYKNVRMWIEIEFFFFEKLFMYKKTKRLSNIRNF